MNISCFFGTIPDVYSNRFWEVENIPSKPILFEEDEYCEILYRDTTTRRPDGRYVVHLPVKVKTFHIHEKLLSLVLFVKRKTSPSNMNCKRNIFDFLKDY